MKAILIFYASLYIPFLLPGQNQAFKFKHLSLENGLSQSSVTCILKDSRGLMWFGTEDGLNKYDGSNFTVYRHLATEKESLSSSYINAICGQDDGILWIATNNGLNYFNPDNEKFTRYLHNPNDSKSISHNYVNALQITKDNQLLVGTSDGLNLFDFRTGFSRYIPENRTLPYHVVSIACDELGTIWVLSKDMIEKIKLKNGKFFRISFYKLPDNSIKHTLLPDSLNIWIGTSKGLVKFNTLTQKSETFRFYDLHVKEPTGYRNYIRPLIYDRSGKLWMGTHGGGLIHFDKTTGKFETVLNDPYNRFSLNSNLIGSIFLDDEGILWVGTYGGGINKCDPTQFKFQHYNNQPGNSNSLSDNGVRAVLLDKKEELWVGTHGGLNRINRNSGQITVYRNDQPDLSTISSNIIRALCEDAYGTIWAGAWDNGLNRFDKKSAKFKRYISFPGSTDSIGQVRCLEADAQGNIWVGGGYGLWKFNPGSGEYKNYFQGKTNSNNPGEKIINRIYFDRKGLLWAGTQNGLYCIDTISGRIKKYLPVNDDNFSISHIQITSIAEDKNGWLWIGTYGGGLNRLDVQSGKFHHFNSGNGLLNDVIYAILIDDSGYIWFTSNAGLCRFDPQHKEFKYFGVEDGIQSNEFNAGACFKSKSGEFFFGGINGFNAFYPGTINIKRATATIVFTDLQIPDEKKSLAAKILDKHISRINHIRLSYSQNTFSIKFAELNYADNTDNNYEYQLEGFEKKWNDLGKKQEITIGNLNPGTYKLHVRVRNDLTKKASVSITVLTPFWLSAWAYVVYALVAIFITALVYRSMKRMKLIRAQFEAKIRNWENNNKASAPSQYQMETGASLQLKTVEVTSLDQRFLERVIQIAEDHIEDAGFDVEKFAAEMFLSRSQLHRKLKTLTGHSATRFIRLIRLKRAAQLLSGNAGTVSEIAYKVGFENIGYFSKCFTDTFGMTPSQYKASSSSFGLKDIA